MQAQIAPEIAIAEPANPLTVRKLTKNGCNQAEKAIRAKVTTR